jgi:hypothetical protein
MNRRPFVLRYRFMARPSASLVASLPPFRRGGSGGWSRVQQLLDVNLRLAGRAFVATSLALTLAGCSASPDRLVVATWWPSADRAKLESEFRAWRTDSGRRIDRQQIEIEWRLVDGWDDWQRELARRHPPDVLLGASIASLERLERSRRLTASGNDRPEPWLAIRSGAIVLADRSGTPAHQADQRRVATRTVGPAAKAVQAARAATFDDPRVDPLSRAWALSLLDSQRFQEGYSQLVLSAGRSRRLGRRSGAARGAVERGEAGSSPVWVAELTDFDLEPARLANGHRPGGDRRRLAKGAQPRLLIEGAAIVAGGASPPLAAEFLRFLAETRTSRHDATASPDRSQSDLPLEALVADWIGATLVDAQDELWAACAALDRAGVPQPALTWLTEPPPWPPASVARLLARGDSDSLDLLEGLAGEITPDPAGRADLIRSWLRPPRVIDLSVLADVAHLAGGRLAGEPHFRAWLKAEWTIWARQRFRRVERLATAYSTTMASHPAQSVRSQEKAKEIP